MKTEDIKKMAQAWQNVQEAAYGKKKMEASDTQMGTITVKTDAEREARAKAYRDKKAKNEASDWANHHKEVSTKVGDKVKSDTHGNGVVTKVTDTHAHVKYGNKTVKHENDELDYSGGKHKWYHPESVAYDRDAAILEALKGKQHKLDHNKNGKIDADDFKGLRKKAKKDQEVEVQTSEAKIDEISKKTLGSYVKKASSDMANNAYALGARDPLKKPGSWDKAFKRKAGIAKATDKLTKEEVELDEGIEKMSHGRLKWHMNTGVPHGSYSKDEMKAERDRRLMHKDSAAAYKKAKPGLSEATKDHGNMNNGSPAGEGLSPSAKKELERKTPAPNDAFDVDTVNKKTFDAIRASAKKAPMRNNDNAQGDKTPPKGK